MSKRRATDAVPANSGHADRKADLAACVRGLNTQFASWVKSQEASRAEHLWIAGLEDYIKHAKQIQAEFSDVVEDHKQRKQSTDAVKPSSLFPPPASKPFSLGTLTTSTSSFPAATSAPPPLSFGAGATSASSSAAATTTTSSSLFGTAPIPSFGAASTPGFGSTAAPSFGAASGFGAGAGSLFKFPTPTPATAIPGGGSGEGGEGGDGEGDEEDGGTKLENAELQKDEGSSVLFQCKGKASVKNGSTWDVKGTGQLTIRAIKGTEKHFVSLVTDAGRSLMTGTITSMSKPSVPNEDPKSKLKRLLVNLVMEHDGKAQGWLTMLTVGNETVREELRVKLMQLSS